MASNTYTQHTAKRSMRGDIEYRLWRDAVLKRDNFACRKCGSGQTLHTHHIKRYADFPGLRVAIDNGITLCRECHRKEHKSKKRELEESYIEWLKGLETDEIPF